MPDIPDSAFRLKWRRGAVEFGAVIYTTEHAGLTGLVQQYTAGSQAGRWPWFVLGEFQRTLAEGIEDTTRAAALATETALFALSEKAD